MKKQHEYLIDQIRYNDEYLYDSVLKYITKNPDAIGELKQAFTEDIKDETHDLLIKYIQKQSNENKREILDEICKIYRKPFLTHRMSLSRVLVVNEEVFLHILKNDKRFFRDGPERTSVNVIENELIGYLSIFYPDCFSKEKNVRKKEIYDALVYLEDISIPPLIKTTRLSPGTGSGKRRRKRYSLSDEGFHEIISIIVLVLRDQLEDIRAKIK